VRLTALGAGQQVRRQEARREEDEQGVPGAWRVAAPRRQQRIGERRRPAQPSGDRVRVWAVAEPLAQREPGDVAAQTLE
jgi:hypothetical protein